MSIINRIADKLGYISKANRAHNIMTVVAGDFVQRMNTPEVNMQACRISSWVNSCVKVIAQNYASVPLDIHDAGDMIIEDGPVYDLLRRPNPQAAEFKLRMQTATQLLIAGDAYWSIEPSNESDIPVELWNLPPEYMEIKDDSEKMIAAYVLKRGGRSVRYEPEEIIHFSWPDPRDQYHGLSPIESIKLSILLYWYILTHHGYYFKNYAVPSAVLSTVQTLTPDLSARMVDAWKKLYSGDQQHSVAVLEGGLTFQALTPPVKDMMFPQLRDAMIEDICAAFGVPPFMVGILKFANYANANAQERLFWKNCIVPIAKLFEDAINLKLPKRLGQDFTTKHNFDKIEALQEDQTQKSTRIVGQYNGGLITRNEGRAQLGYDEVDGGDEFKAAATFGGLPAVTDETQLGDNSSGMTAKSTLVKLAPWQLHEKTLQKYEKPFAEFMASFFRSQLRRVMADIDKATGGLRSSLFVFVTKDSLKPDDAHKIFDADAEKKALRKAAQPKVTSVMQSQYNATISRLGVDSVFNVTNPRVAHIIETGLNKLVGVNDTTYDAIKQRLIDAYENGDSIETLKKNIRGMYDEWYAGRSLTIAQTEMNKYVNGGTLAAYRDSGVVQRKVWSTNMDGNERDSHAAADGQSVGLDEKFVVGDDLLDCPSDPNGSAGEVINCRCGMTSIVEGE
jgi:HK97 family phage portal protein